MRPFSLYLGIILWGWLGGCFQTTHAWLDHNCPRFIHCTTGGAGFGDQLEHYIYCVHVAKLLHATVVVSGFNRGPSQHQGITEYRMVAELLGIDFTPMSHWQSRFQQLSVLKMAYDEIVELQKQVARGAAELPCFRVIDTSIKSCPDQYGGWCDFRPGFTSLQGVWWILRRNAARQKCIRRGYGFTPSREVNMVWHVRTGDICLHCSTAYFEGLYPELARAIRWRVHLSFESQHELGFIRRSAMFRNATFNVGSTLMESVCRLLTADVVVTSGSSLPALIAAFAPPFSPVVVEEMRKETDGSYSIPVDIPNAAHHYFQADAAVLVEKGIPLMSEEELFGFFHSTLKVHFRFPVNN